MSKEIFVFSRKIVLCKHKFDVEISSHLLQQTKSVAFGTSKRDLLNKFI